MYRVQHVALAAAVDFHLTAGTRLFLPVFTPGAGLLTGGMILLVLGASLIVLLLSVPAYQWAWSDHDVRAGHHRRYTRSGILALVEGAGMQVVRATYAFGGVFRDASGGLFGSEYLVPVPSDAPRVSSRRAPRMRGCW